LVADHNTIDFLFRAKRDKVAARRFFEKAIAQNGSPETVSIELKTLIAQPVTLWIQQADKSYLPHNGYVHTARRLGSNSGLTSYQLGFASWMHFLKFRRDQRIWQDKTADDVITDVFNAQPARFARF
jgi:uncharacterized protein involved in type VI secretion and phage assembly